MRIQKTALLLVLCFVCAELSLLAAQSMITVYPNEYPGGLSNPLKGFRPGDNDWNKYPYPTVVRDYIRWNEIENDAGDGVDKIINYSNAKWKNFPAANIKVVPRVYIDWDSSPGNEYWPDDLESGDWTSQEFKDRVVNMIYKLGEAWDTDPRVAWVQTGIIGYWGEQENPVGVDEDGWVERMGEAFEAAFPNKLLVVRNQNHWSAEGYHWGVYWDSFAHPAQTSGSWTRVRNANADGRYLTHPVEGEVAYNWGYDSLWPVLGKDPDETLSTPQYYNYLIDVIRELHCSALGWISSYNQNDPTVAASAALVQKEFGYRFVIPEFSCSSRAEPGGTLDINFKVMNTGAAPMYEGWPLAFVLIDESTQQIVWSKVLQGNDIRLWRPGNDYDYDTRTYTTPAAEHTIAASVDVPASIPVGQYMVGLSILEPYSRTPGIFFAIENFLKESQTQPLCRIGIGEDRVGSHEINSDIFGDPVSDDNRYYTMEWTGPIYMLTTNATTGGAVSPGSGSYRENTYVTLKATAELGYVFSEWTGDLTGSTNPAKINMDSDKNITAHFTSVPTYTLSARATEGGSISIYPEGGVYNEGTVVTITAKAELGYVFDGWSGDFSGSDNPAEITMDSDKNVVANFTAVPVYTLTTKAIGGTITLDPPGPRYNEGTKVRVKAIAKPGYEFTNWSGDTLDFSARINPNRMTMDSDKNITAEFVGNPETLNLIQNGDFSAGLDSWSPQVISPAQATISVDNGECKVDIQAVSGQQWHVNILQQHIQLETDVSYTLSFDARATADKIVSAKAQFDHDPWTSSLEEPIKITTTMQRYSVTWLQDEPADYYKVGLFFGSDTTNVWVDNVELVPPNTGVNNQKEIILPQQTQLGQNYPNPFNPTTTIPYQLSDFSHVKLSIHNLLGQHIITLVDEQQAPGVYTINWSGKNSKGQSMASGLYIYRLETGTDSIQTKKFLLAR